jgi:hypothetical protein
MELFNGQVRTIGVRYWYIKILKPIYGDCVAIRSRIIDEAIKKKKLLLVEVNGKIEMISPKLWKKEAQKISKVFKIPECPMILYQRTIRYASSKPLEAYEIE